VEVLEVASALSRKRVLMSMTPSKCPTCRTFAHSAALAARAHQAQPLAPHGEIGNGRADESRGDNVTSTDRGNSQTYLLRRLARDAPEVLERLEVVLVDHGGDRKSGKFKASQERQNQGDNVTLKRGNQAAYIRARLDRDHSDVAAALDRGEYRSARAAAIAAGIIKPVSSVRLVSDPAKVASSIVERMDRDWCIALVTAMAELIRDESSRSPP